MLGFPRGKQRSDKAGGVCVREELWGESENQRPEPGARAQVDRLACNYGNEVYSIQIIVQSGQTLWNAYRW